MTVFFHRWLLIQSAALLALSLPLFLHASNDSSLYRADIPVQSQSAAERNRMLEQGLSRVLVKLSGNQLVSTIPAVSNQLPRANQLLQQFQYTTDPNAPNQQILSLYFSPEGIRHILAQAGQPLWPTNRAAIALWVAIDHNNKLEYLTSSSNLGRKIAETAKERGLPIIFPLLDITDMSRIPVDTNKIDNLDVFRQAAQRYQTAINIIAVLQKDRHGSWTSNWQLVFSNEQLNWRERANQSEDLVQAGINTVVDAMVARYMGVTQQQTNQIELIMHNIDSVDDYIETTNMLKTSPLVSTLQVISIQADQIHYQLKLQGTRQALQEELAKHAGITLMQTQHNNQPETNVNQLNYQRVP